MGQESSPIQLNSHEMDNGLKPECDIPSTIGCGIFLICHPSFSVACRAATLDMTDLVQL